MAEGDKAECHTVQRQREFTLKICRAISEKLEKSRPFTKISKISFIAHA